MEIVTSSAIREWCWFVAGWSDSTALGAVSVPVGRGREESSGGGDDAVACVNENIEERTRETVSHGWTEGDGVLLGALSLSLARHGGV